MVSIFILVFFHTMDKRQFLLEYCSWCESWKIPNNTEINHIMVSFADHYNAISIERLPSKTKIGKDSWERFMKIILFCVSPSFPQLQRLFFFIKNIKKTTLQQVAGGNTPNIVLKRMLRYFLKTLPFKKILQFQEKKCFFY